MSIIITKYEVVYYIYFYIENFFFIKINDDHIFIYCEI